MRTAIHRHIRHGKTRRYRYYTCFTRTRYGKHATCTAPRLPADEIDQLILNALYTFYCTAEPILTAMIERAQAQRDTGADDRHAELAAVTTQITTAEAAITRYHLAFENGTMDDATAGDRIRELRQRLARLHSRRAELDQAPAEPTAPPPGTITKIRDHLATIMTSGTDTERKAAVEALVHEVQLTDQGVIPVFKIPTDDNAPLPDGSGADEQDGSPVRTMVRSVEPRGLEPLTPTLPVWCATSCATAPRCSGSSPAPAQ
jgi:site-specific DNA recombinase